MCISTWIVVLCVNNEVVCFLECSMYVVVLVCTYICMFWYNGPALVEYIVVLVLQC